MLINLSELRGTAGRGLMFEDFAPQLHSVCWLFLKTFRYNLEDGNDRQSRNVGQLLT